MLFGFLLLRLVGQRAPELHTCNSGADQKQTKKNKKKQNRKKKQTKHQRKIYIT
jgi:hypothetical protein